MDRQQIGVRLTIDGLKLPFKIDIFEDRLILQKTVYLAQAAGIHLGYYYRWYLHGPYSPSLTRDEYAIATDISVGLDDSEGWKLDNGSSQRLEGIRGIFTEPQRDKLAKKLELLASVHFLVGQRRVAANDTKRISETLKKFEKDFTENEVQAALRKLVDHGMLRR